jgi:hypothetical protein
MDLPRKSYYGVKCPICPCTLWYREQQRVELLCTVSFKDKGLPYIEESLGIVIGFGNFSHTCRPDLDYQ